MLNAYCALRLFLILKHIWFRASKLLCSQKCCFSKWYFGLRFCVLALCLVTVDALNIVVSLLMLALSVDYIFLSVKYGFKLFKAFKKVLLSLSTHELR